jgi:hypothetical protein
VAAPLLPHGPMAAPPLKHGPTMGARPENVGNNTDFSAQVPSGDTIAQATGTFLFAYNIYQNPGEVDSKYGNNAFSLQMNSNRFPSNLCGASPNCSGWEQFVFGNYPSGPFSTGVFIQYWLINAESCPPSWMSYSGASGGAPGCFMNSPMTSLSPVTIADLDNLYLQGTAASGGDYLSLTNYGSGEINAMGQDSALNLSQNWNTAEFNIFGGSDGSEAEFNFGTVIGVATQLIAPTVPTCFGGSTTGEQANLNLVRPCLPYGYGPVLGGTSGSIEFMESNTGVAEAPLLNTNSASSVTMNSAELNGTVNPYLSVPLLWFEYGTSGGALNCSSPPLTAPYVGSELQVNQPAPFSAAIYGLSSSTTYYFISCALYTGGLLQGNLESFTTPPSASTTGLAFYTLPPCRVADTRSFAGFTGDFGPPSLSAGSERSFPLSLSSCNIPSDAQAYSLNIGVVPQTTLGYLTVWPTGSPLPIVSTLNSLNGALVSNAAIVPAGTSGDISLYASNNTDVFIDINGYFAAPTLPQPLAFYPLPPCRVADTRSFGGFTGPFGPPTLTAGETRSFPIASGSCNVPAIAQAYSLNMTVSPVTTLSFLTTWPTGGPFPTVSTLNDPNGGYVANAAMVPAGTSGDIEVYVTDATDVIIDIDGYYAPPGATGALYFYPLTPCRVADTRSYGGFTGAFGPPTMTGGSARDFPMLSSPCTSSAQAAQAYSLNMTLWPSAPVGFLTVWPTGQPFPTVSTTNSPSGQPVANAAIVPAGMGGDIDVYVSNTTDVFFDINGYFGP